MPSTNHNLIGYARVSTHEQNLDLQLDALKEAGCQKIFKDTISGAKAERPGLDEALAYLRPGDTLIVWRLDRFGRSLNDLVARVAELQEREIGFRCLNQPIDTTTPSGKLTFHIFAALAEFERDLIRERTIAGLAAARARGRKGGRKPSLSSTQIKLASKLIQDKGISIKEICSTLNISTSTLYRYVAPNGAIRRK